MIIIIHREKKILSPYAHEGKLNNNITVDMVNKLPPEYVPKDSDSQVGIMKTVGEHSSPDYDSSRWR